MYIVLYTVYLYMYIVLYTIKYQKVCSITYISFPSAHFKTWLKIRIVLWVCVEPKHPQNRIDINDSKSSKGEKNLHSGK